MDNYPEGSEDAGSAGDRGETGVPGPTVVHQRDGKAHTLSVDHAGRHGPSTPTVELNDQFVPGSPETTEVAFTRR